MGKKRAASRTPPKKNAKETSEVSRKGKEKHAMSKGKAKVKFSDPLVEEEESVENDSSGSADEEAEESVEGEDSIEEEESGDEDAEETGGEEEDNLDEVVQMATELGSKKNGKKKEKVSEAPVVQPKPLKVDRTKAKTKVGKVAKELEVGQSSKIKATETAVVRKRKRAEGMKMKEVDDHGSPAALHYVIEHLSTAHKKDVEDIGFGGLLELKSSKFLHTVIDWLLERYDTVTRLFLFNRNVHFAVSKHDIYDVFMLPCGGADVPAVSDGPELLHIWREKFHKLPKKDIPLDQVKDEMLRLVQGGPEFKKLFVVFAMGSFLVLTVHN